MKSMLLLVLVQMVAVSCGDVYNCGAGAGGSMNQGAVYTRWGRTECGSPSDEVVYSGVVGGGFWNRIGGASNYVCLSGEPEWGNYDDRANGGGEIFGTEYETHYFDPFQTGTSFDDKTVPCIVCRSSTAVSSVMIPGRLNCYSGWQKAYNGYLMSASVAHVEYRTEYICVDAKPEYASSSVNDLDEAVLFTVEGHCGTLPCLPYVEGREITCVVCMK